MKDIILIPVIAAAFIFGYYAVVKINRFTNENQYIITLIRHKGYSKIKIGMESSALLECVSPALKNCTEYNPNISFTFRKGSEKRLLERLNTEKADIVLLKSTDSVINDKKYAFLSIPSEDSNSGLKEVVAVWKKSKKSKSRDHVIFALESEHSRIKQGYADYL